MQLEEAISLLRTCVKYSAVPGQKHIDLALANVHDLPRCEEALKLVNGLVMRGEMTRDQLLEKLNLK